MAELDKIHITDLQVQCILGVNEVERHNKQNIFVSLTLFFDISQCGRSDSIYDTVDYSEVSSRVYQHCSTSEPLTIEHLATNIAKICLEYVEEVIVRIDKPSAVWLAKAPAIEIRRTRKYFIEEERRLGLASLSTKNYKEEDGVIAYIAMGSNIGDRATNIFRALQIVKDYSCDEGKIKVLSTSYLYETPPAYVIDQPAFLNCACKIATKISPLKLLRIAKEVEDQLGREKTIRNGPRSIDVDILFYGNQIIENAQTDNNLELIVPHIGIPERDFVLGPLMDIAPDLMHPKLKKTVRHLFKSLPKVELTKVLPMSTDHNELLWRIHEKTWIMGILNTTPDSFSDGGQFNSIDSAVKKAKELVAQGADIIDIGGQSTRPNAPRVSVEEELSRVVPIIQAIRKELPNVLISIDTFYAEVAKQAVQNGANVINDVSGGTLDSEMFSVAAKLSVPIVITHIRGDPQTMSFHAVYDDVVKEVKKALHERAVEAEVQGVYKWNIILDPGIGFAKESKHNFLLLKSNASLTELGYPLLYGSSRKGFIGQATGKTDALERDWGTAPTVTAAIQLGADIVRIHNVEKLKDVIAVSDAIYKKTY